jgi:hypothetical protein
VCEVGLLLGLGFKVIEEARELRSEGLWSYWNVIGKINH